MKCVPNSDIVVVIGVGGVGLSALLALASLKVEKIIAVDVSDEKLELARLSAQQTLSTQVVATLNLNYWL